MGFNSGRKRLNNDSPWHQRLCPGVPSVCRQEVADCFTSASVANVFAKQFPLKWHKGIQNHWVIHTVPGAETSLDPSSVGVWEPGVNV
jgi:hypothetical protein